MRKRDNDFDLSHEEVINEFMKSYDSHHRRHHKHHSKHHHHHHHSHHHHSNDNINDNVEVKNLIDGEKENDTLTSLDAKKPEEKKERKKKIPLFFRILIIIVAVLFSLAIMGTCAVLIMNAVTRNKLLKSREDVVLQTIDGAVAYDDSGKTVEYKGQKYVYNENVITFAFFGIDDKGINTNVLDVHGEAGQADTILVFAYNIDNGDVSIISVPRDSMVDVDIYNQSGKFAGTERLQVCLSYAFGNGGVSSCENTVKSLERILMGVPIDMYFSMKVRGIDALNAAVGGIELTSIETIGDFVKGQKVHLTGTAARFYVTRRDRSKIDSDKYRRERQMQYLRAFIDKTLGIAKKNIGIVTTLYNTAKQYSVTDITLSDAVFYATNLLNTSAKIKSVTTLGGEYVNTDSVPEYILDEEQVYQTILDTFYTKV